MNVSMIKKYNNSTIIYMYQKQISIKIDQSYLRSLGSTGLRKRFVANAAETTYEQNL